MKENIDISSESNVQIFSGQGFFANVLDKISLFAKAAGIKIKAGHGQVEVMSGSTLNNDLAAMPKLQMDYDEQFFLRNRTGKAMPNIK